jgi:hypothetical protein
LSHLIGNADITHATFAAHSCWAASLENLPLYNLIVAA